MIKVEDILKDKDNVELLKLYAVGLEKDNLFQDHVRIEVEDDAYKMYFVQHHHLNNWGQGDLLLTIDNKTRIVSIYYQDIDGENWSKSWYVNLKRDIDLLKLLKETQGELIKKYRKDKEKLKAEVESLKFTLEHERYNLENDRDKLKTEVGILRKRLIDSLIYNSEMSEQILNLKEKLRGYNIPILSKLKRLFVKQLN